MTNHTHTRKTQHRRAPILFFIILVVLIIFTIQKAVASRSVESLFESIPSADASQKDAATDIDGKENGDWEQITMANEDLSCGDLILVSNKTPYDFANELDLASIYDHKTGSYNVKDKDVLLQKNVIEHLNSLMDDFFKDSRLRTINIVAGYRTYEFQQELYNNSAAKNGKEHAAKYVAQPGGSEHHTGLAVDLSIFYTENGTSEEYTGTGEYSWINENAWEYGFIQRYKSGKESVTAINEEPWHFRYVGLPHAQIITNKDMCLEEYLDYIKEYTFKGDHLSVESQGQKYEIYFCKGFDVHVPKDKLYDISGNNVDGFIVTVHM